MSLTCAIFLKFWQRPASSRESYYSASFSDGGAVRRQVQITNLPLRELTFQHRRNPARPPRCCPSLPLALSNDEPTTFPVLHSSLRRLPTLSRTGRTRWMRS